MRSYLKNRNFRTGFMMICFMLVLLVVGFFYIPHDPNEMDVTNKFATISTTHLLGTDDFGRDILSRIMIGLRVSFLVGFVVVIFGAILGTIIGAIAGYYGGFIDEVIMKLIDTQMAFPGVLLALILIAIMGKGLGNMMFALGIMSIPRFTRMSRSGFMRYRDAEFVKAARVRGAGDLRIMVYHILPNIIPELTVTASLSFAGAVMSEAGLSYLGLGIQPPSPSFGKMLSEAQAYILRAPWYVLIPALFLMILVMGFNLLGDGFQEMNKR